MGGLRMERIEDLSVKEYLEKLADSSFPSPASGSAAATIAGMAAGLLEMSCKVTMKKNEKSIPVNIDEIEKVRHQFLALATEDIEVLNSIIQARKTKEKFPDQYESALKNATDTLLFMIKSIKWIKQQIELLIPVCAKSVSPELIGSGHMAEAALKSAKLGVEANLKLSKDVRYKDDINFMIGNVLD